MELRQLRYFVAVAEELHFARAAERVHISQQALSFQIKQLEEEIGTALFERTTRRVELTAAGQALLKEAQAVFDHLQRGIETAQRAGRGEVGRLVVGYIGTTLYNIMPPIVRAFREQYPDVEVVLLEVVPPALEEGILAGDIDAGFSGIMAQRSPDLAYESLYLDRVAVALPKGHPLEMCDAIPLTALANEPFVMYSRVQKKQGFDQIVALCQSRGFSPRIVQEASTESAVIGLVAGGVGVAIVINSLSNVRTDEVTYRPLVDPVVEANFGLVWSRHTVSPVVKTFVQTAQEVAQAGGFQSTELTRLRSETALAQSIVTASDRSSNVS